MTRTFLLVSLLAGVMLVGIGSLSRAARPKVWHHHQPQDFQNGHADQVVVSNEGVLRLSKELKLLADLEVMHIWDIVEDKKGNLFVATGDEGKLFKVTPEGETSVVYTSTDSQILCLALRPNGSLIAGTGPRGQVIEITPQGKARILVKNVASYVWSLSVDEKKGTILAGTGPGGRIYQVTPKGKASVFYQTSQDHVLCLARDQQGQVYAGTDKEGLVYRINPQGKGFVLYKAHQSEVRSLVVTAEGVYAGTSSPTRKVRPSSTYSRNGSDSSPVNDKFKSKLVKEPSSSNKIKAVKTSSGTSPSGEEEQEVVTGIQADAPEIPDVGENSLYRITDDGTVQELFREKAMILTLLPSQGQFLVGTGMKGQLYEIHEKTREKIEIARLDHGQIHTLLRRKDGSIVLGTGDPGKLYVLKSDYSSVGTITSDVLDAKIQSRWGAAHWQADLPQGTNATVAFRSGNVSQPDKTWSEWTEEQTDPQQARISCPPARFLQYRITLHSNNLQTSPEIYSLALHYVTTNHAPEIEEVTVPDLVAGELEDEKLKIQWEAVDPNEDELTFDVYVRKSGWNQWVCVKKKLGKTRYEWDPRTMPSGMYRVKVVASDALDNTPQETLTANRVSTPFPVTTRPPAVEVRFVGLSGKKAILEATSKDSLVRLTQGGYCLNGGTWHKVFPEDGIFDSQTETFRFMTVELDPGNYVLVLRIRNAAGIYGTADVVFTVFDRKGE